MLFGFARSKIAFSAAFAHYACLYYSTYFKLIIDCISITHTFSEIVQALILKPSLNAYRLDHRQ